VAERETLNEIGNAFAQQGNMSALLDDYLRKIGITSSAARALWSGRVIEMLQTHSAEIAADDLREEAIDRMYHLIETRLAQIGKLDLQHDRRKIAHLLLVLQDKKYSHLLDAIFNPTGVELDHDATSQLDRAFADFAPQPVPADAPLAMPVQTIELRSLKPWRWFKHQTQ
jgi:hypothetical protein